MSELQVDPLVLRAAADAWDDQSDGLDAALRSLASIDSSLLGERVSGHTEAFVSTWTTELRRLSRQAGDHARALRDNADFVGLADRETAEAMSRLLPLPHRSRPGGAK